MIIMNNYFQSTKLHFSHLLFIDSKFLNSGLVNFIYVYFVTDMFFN